MGSGGEVVFRYCGDSGVSEDAPGESRGGAEEKGEEDGSESVHCRTVEKSLVDNWKNRRW